ncbi:hypothetical protein SLS53_006910 [Cytospora paraplurivora]|uniref:N-acetyltransferase ESCO zinc-finger domain-containing protein n=1 Tax=Cytospora paraplurivora TaxID=2898453 RepID=A0AAN9U2M1_9PEZI
MKNEAVRLSALGSSDAAHGVAVLTLSERAPPQSHRDTGVVRLEQTRPDHESRIQQLAITISRANEAQLESIFYTMPYAVTDMVYQAATHIRLADLTVCNKQFFPDLQTRDEGVSASQRHKDKSCSSISEAGLVDPEEEDPSQPLNSPTRSSDSFPEADICDREDFPGAQLHLNPAQSSSQLHKMQERSIHDIGAVFAPRKKRLVLRIDQTTRRDTSRQPRSLDLNHGRHGKSGGAPFEQEEVQEAQQDLSGRDSSLFTSTEPIQRVSSHAGGATVGVAFASDTGNANEAAASCELPQSGRVNGLQDGPQDGHQGSIAKTPPKSKKRLQRRLPSTTRSNANQLVTPSTSTTPIPEAQPDQENEDDDAVVSGPALGAKSKRRLTLHSGSYNSQPPQKRRKGPPKKQAAVQTTLSLSVGGGSGMRECRVCDTVYNPFHPEDAKLHARRHAVVLKSGTSG